MKTYSIEKTIDLNAPIDRVFSALTNSDEIPKYYPLIAVESSWNKGDEVLYIGEVNGVPFTDFGVIEIISSPNTYQYRYWSDNHGTERSEENQLTISYNLVKSRFGTTLTVMQNNIQSFEMFTLMNTQVWGYLLESFKSYIEKHS